MSAIVSSRSARGALHGGSLTAMIMPIRLGAPFTPGLSVLLVILAALAVCLIAATRRRRMSVAAAAATVCVTAVGQAMRLPSVPLRVLMPFTGGSPGLAVALITVIAWLIGHSIRQAHSHADEMRAQTDAQVATAERLRIARDLHDQVAHAISIIAIQAGAGSRVIGTEPEKGPRSPVRHRGHQQADAGRAATDGPDPAADRSRCRAGP
jgi:signal transduction histidine kinase